MASSSIVPLILEFIKGGNMQAASKPGFGHALRLSYNLISKERLTWEDKTLTYRYTFTEHVSTGAFMAIMDELTTNACFGVGQPSAPGVSLQMQMELTKVPLDLLKEVDIVSTVVKLGRTVSYVRSDFINPVNQQLVAFGSHVKYMPTGNFFMDTIFNNRWAFDLYARMALASPPDQYEEKDLLKGVIGPCLEYQGVGSATFTMNLEHVNPFGGLHGGCHALLMELVGETLAKEQLMSPSVVLESMSIDYISAGRGVMTIEAEPLTKIQMRVVIYSDKGRIVSDGSLRWSAVERQSTF